MELACDQQPDLVLLDIKLRQVSGLDISRELRRRQFAAPILMATGLGTVEARITGLDAGADDYLTKPFDDRELLACVRALLRREQRTQAESRGLTVLACQDFFGMDARSSPYMGPADFVRRSHVGSGISVSRRGFPLARCGDRSWSFPNR